jgi:predicted DNA-binding antitoxin AbrB/MazE fold protein
MNEPFQATYQHGVLKPEGPLSLPEESRVTGFINSVEVLAKQQVAQPSLTPTEFDQLLDSLSLNNRSQ